MGAPPQLGPLLMLEDLRLPLLLYVPAKEVARLFRLSGTAWRMHACSNTEVLALAARRGFPNCTSLRQLSAAEAGQDWLMALPETANVEISAWRGGPQTVTALGPSASGAVRGALRFNGTENIASCTSKVLCLPARWSVNLRHRAVALSLGVLSSAQLGASPTICPFNARRP